VDPDNLFGRLHSPQDQLFQHHLAEAGDRNPQFFRSHPIRTLENKHFVSLSLGRDDQNFNHYLPNTLPCRHGLYDRCPDYGGLVPEPWPGDVILVGLYRRVPLSKKAIAPIIKK